MVMPAQTRNPDQATEANIPKIMTSKGHMDFLLALSAPGSTVAFWNLFDSTSDRWANVIANPHRRHRGALRSYATSAEAESPSVMAGLSRRYSRGGQILLAPGVPEVGPMFRYSSRSRRTSSAV